MLARKLVLFGALLPALGMANLSLTAPYSSDYTSTEYTNIAGVPGNYGGVTFLNANTILLGGSANNSAGGIYSVPVIRGADNQIVGFGAGTLYANAPYIDGGLFFGPGGTLFFTEYPLNNLGEIPEPCSLTCTPAAQPNLTGLGIASSVGTAGIVPAGFQGAGNFLIGSYSGGGWYNVAMSPSGDGTYVPTSANLLEQTGGGPEGIAWVLGGSPDFATNTALVSQYSTGTVVAYQVDSSGAPTGPGQTFITGLSGAEGATVDPVTGDFLFSTYGGGNTIAVISGFVAPTP